MMQRKGFAIVGAGLWGSQHAHVLSTLPEALLVGIFDTDPGRAEALRERSGARRTYPDLATLLADPEVDAVTVATPDFAHAEVILAALAAGRDVLSEKPLATTVEESETVVAAARRSGRKLMVDFHNRVSPAIAAARACVAAGEIGRPLHLSARLNNTTFVPLEMLSWAGRSSALWFLGSHAVDALRFITGDEVRRVQALRRGGYLEAKGVSTADVHLALLEFASGAIATLENSWVLPPDSPLVFDFRLEIVGEKGALQISTADNGAFRKFTGAGLRTTDLFGSVPAAGPRIGGFVYESIARFVDAVVADAPLLAGPEDGLAATRILAAIEQAAASGVAVSVPGAIARA
ncbi:MAG: Gfo/Idh/MocA family protein [Acetobacteraceae bacterium]